VRAPGDIVATVEATSGGASDESPESSGRIRANHWEMADSLNHDSPWKDALNPVPRSLLEVTFPDVAASIDWSVEPRHLEQELRENHP